MERCLRIPNLINQPGDKVKIDKVLLVKDYIDVFPKELASLLPEQKIEFIIELQFEIAPISWAPYQMATIKLKELKI